MCNNRVILYCRLPRSHRCSRFHFKECGEQQHLQPLVIFSFLITSSCLFKATLLCCDIDSFTSSLGCFFFLLPLLPESQELHRALNRARKELKAGWSNSYWVTVPSELWVSIGILSVLVKDTRANESGGREKGGLEHQPTGSMVNPRPPPLLFFGLGFGSMRS